MYGINPFSRQRQFDELTYITVRLQKKYRQVDKPACDGVVITQGTNFPHIV